MEIYKDLSSPATQQFEKLLNSQLSKNKIEEGNLEKIKGTQEKLWKLAKAKEDLRTSGKLQFCMDKK